MKKSLSVNTLAFGNLKMRRKQYTVLIIGIILAMVFSSGTVFFLDCYMTSKDEYCKQKCGIADYIYFNISKTIVEKGKEEGLFDEVGYAHVIGYGCNADTSLGSAVGWLDDTAQKLAYISVTDGRLPEKEGEIAVEKDVLVQLDLEDVEVGSAITFDNFKTADGTGYFEKTDKKSYTLVGILSNKRSTLIRQSFGDVDTAKYFPGAIVAKNTLPSAGGKEILAAYTTFKDHTNIYDNMWKFFETQKIDYINGLDVRIARVNESYSFGSGDTDFPLVVMLSIVLMLVSCLAIINAFNTNLRSRRTQIGLLRAVGTTRRQIIKIFGRETLIISLLCAPVSIILSYGIVRVLVMFVDNFIFKPKIWILFACAAVGVVCVMLAALIPLASASRITPMQAIRNMEYSRKMKKYKVKSQSQYNVSSLLIKRNNMFNKGKRAFVCILLIVTIVFSCFGFSFVKYISNEYYNPPYDYRMGSYSYMYSDYEHLEDNGGLTENNKQEILRNPYVKSVRGSKKCSVNILSDEIPDYFRVIKCWEFYPWYTDGNESDSGIYFTKDNYKQKFKIPDEMFQIKEKYGISQYLLPIDLGAADKDDIEKLESCVIEGKIDISKLNSGEEILLIAPEKYYLYLERSSDRKDVYLTSSQRDERVNGEILETVENCYHAGDVIDISMLTTNEYSSTYDGENPITNRKDKTVKIGAVLNTNYYSTVDLMFYSELGLLTTTEGLNTINNNIKYQYLCTYLKTECTDEIDKQITDIFDKINARTPGVELFSNYSYSIQQKEEVKTMFIGLLSLIILFFSVAGSMINNSMTAKIRESKKAIGTLRAVGASQRDLVKSYVGQTASIFAVGYGVGFALYFIIYGIAALAFKSLGSAINIKINIGYTIIMCLVLFAVCSVNLIIQVRQLMKYSIVENIREL